MENINVEEVRKEEINMESRSSTEIIQKKLWLVRSFVEKQDPTSKEVDDVVLKRFLRHHKLDVEKASDSFLKYQKWRQAFVPNGSIPESEIPYELSQKKVFMQGFDKKGLPLAVVFYGRHVSVKSKDSLNELKRFLVYSLDKICARMSNGQEQFSFIGDLNGFGYSNCDLIGIPMILSTLQDYYPETLGHVYLINQPYIFKTMWKIINPFINNKTKKKLIFLDNKTVTSRLLQDIDEDQLPDIYGGKLPLVPIEDC